MTDTEVIVIGLGAGGGVVVRELARNDIDTVGIEAGPWPGAHDQDELQNLISGRLYNTVHDTPESFRPPESSNGEKTNGKFSLYGRNVGGGTVHYCGVSWRFLPEHFNMKSEFGELEDANLADWPFDYKDLAPYYRRAERVIGISGPPNAQPEHPDNWSYPMKAVDETYAGQLVREGAEELGYEPFTSPQAVVTESYDEPRPTREACTYCGHCCFYGCYEDVKGAKSSTLVTTIPDAIETGNLEVKDNALAKRIEVDSNGDVSGVTYIDKEAGKERTITADAVVVSGNALETPRLLLNSSSEHHPDGLANSSGQVGRNLMFHMDYTQIFGKFDESVQQANYGTWSNKSVENFILSSHIDEDVDFVTGSVLQMSSINGPVKYAGHWKQLYAGDKMAPDSPSWGEDFQREMENFENTIWMWAPVEDVPRERNRIQPDPSNPDEWGIPGMEISYENHPQDFKAQEYVAERGKEILKAGGASEVWSVGVGANHRGSSHLMGTARMGTDPDKSVVDGWGRSHDVNNLFIADGSLFPTSTGYNPTETIQALAFRVAGEIIDEWV